jgi:replication factor C large subunit
MHSHTIIIMNFLKSTQVMYENKDSLREILAPATQQKSFFYEGKVVLIDEVDGISGNADRGGMQEISKLFLNNLKFPIILYCE